MSYPQTNSKQNAAGIEQNGVVRCVYLALRTRVADAKEPEMQIGNPTDVKHVAHIGWDNSVTAPSWVAASTPIARHARAPGPSI